MNTAGHVHPRGLARPSQNRQGIHPSGPRLLSCSGLSGSHELQAQREKDSRETGPCPAVTALSLQGLGAGTLARSREQLGQPISLFPSCGVTHQGAGTAALALQELRDHSLPLLSSRRPGSHPCHPPLSSGHGSPDHLAGMNTSPPPPSGSWPCFPKSDPQTQKGGSLPRQEGIVSHRELHSVPSEVLCLQTGDPHFVAL